MAKLLTRQDTANEDYGGLGDFGCGCISGLKRLGKTLKRALRKGRARGTSRSDVASAGSTSSTCMRRLESLQQHQWAFSANRTGAPSARPHTGPKDARQTEKKPSPEDKSTVSAASNCARKLESTTSPVAECLLTSTIAQRVSGCTGYPVASASPPPPLPESLRAAIAGFPTPDIEKKPDPSTQSIKQIQIPKPQAVGMERKIGHRLSGTTSPTDPKPFHSLQKSPPSAPKPISKGVAVKKLPPPLPKASLLRKKRISRQPQVAELFREFVVGVPEILSSTPSQKSKDSNPKKSGLGVIGEMASKSPYFLGIARDVETYQGMIQELIAAIHGFQPKDMEQVVKFVDFVDGSLAPLTDEVKVLEGFDWPPRYTHIREAAGVYRQLSEVQEGFLHWVRCRRTMEDEMLAMEKHLGAMIEKIDLLLKDQEAMEKRFKDALLPWSTSVWVRTKQASLQLFLAFASLAIPEVASTTSKKRSQSLLKRLVEFAFKVHALAAGFCPQCVAKFEEIRALVAAARA
ncbi:hypothetical protein BSKO_06803 [Bryopsis sp. KO-2023]|nr:hypothetical protein BSKO_06803 [Bryopsis sp. KO-2023]